MDRRRVGLKDGVEVWEGDSTIPPQPKKPQRRGIDRVALPERSNWRIRSRSSPTYVTSFDLAEPVAAKRRIAELETELAATKRANELRKQVVPQKGRFEAIVRMAREGTPRKSPPGCSQPRSPGSTRGVHGR